MVDLKNPKWEDFHIIDMPKQKPLTAERIARNLKIQRVHQMARAISRARKQAGYISTKPNYKKEYDGVIEALHLKPKDFTNVMTFGGNQRAGVYEISIGLPNSKVYNNVEVLGSELGDYSILFGMDVITRTDFLITNADGKTTFQFRTPSEGCGRRKKQQTNIYNSL